MIFNVNIHIFYLIVWSVWTGFEDECIYILLLVKVKNNYVPVIIIIIIIIVYLYKLLYTIAIAVL